MDGETFLCIATRAWNSLWRDSQQIMSRIAQQNRVLYFEPGRNPDRPIGSELLRNSTNFLSLRYREVQQNLIAIESPASLPLARQFFPRPVLQLTAPLTVTLNARVLNWHIRRAMDYFGVQTPILWLYDPKHVGLIGKFDEKLVCYYNYDEYAEFEYNRRIRELTRQLDDRLAQLSDIVFTTSRGQWRRRRNLNAETYFIPNGVDFDLFNRALDPQTPIAADISNLKGPRIGYVGWLGYQVDVDLLIQVAEAFPDSTLVLVGPDCLPDDARRNRLHHLNNVAFLGQKPLDKLPEYLKALDVALIPYRIGGHTLTVYPLKLHEYLAAGRPIVATPLPELGAFRHVVRIAEAGPDFIRQVRLAIRDHSAEAVEVRVAVAHENTWDKRVEDIYHILDQKNQPAPAQNAGGERASQQPNYRSVEA